MNASSGELLNFQDFLPETRKTYMVSATLHISPQVSLADLLGFEQYHYMSIEREKQTSQRIWIDEEMPNVAEISDEAYADAIAERIYQIRQLDEQMLVLFNSKKAMFDVSERLDEMELHHLTQEKTGQLTMLSVVLNAVKVIFYLGLVLSGKVWTLCNLIK